MERVAIASSRTTTALVKNCAPAWMRFEAPSSVPPYWYGLVTSYFFASMAALEKDPPVEAVLQIQDHKDHLRFQITLSDEKDRAKEIRALTTVAQLYEKLSSLLLRERSWDSAEANLQSDLRYRSREPEVTVEGDQQTLFDASDSDRVLESETFTKSGQVGGSVRVFSWPEKGARDGGRSSGRDADGADRIRRAFTRLAASGRTRPLQVPAPDWGVAVVKLMDDFPNFKSVIQTVIKPHLALIDKGYTHRLNPIILVGPPGIGKSFFAQRLAEVLGLRSPLFIPMATETNNSKLSGSSTFWSNSSPGLLFETLAWGATNQRPVANPLIILDEVDKVCADKFDPLGPLYSLLEVDTARVFQDQSMPDLVINASHCRFVATANDTTNLPAPLLSRAMVFRIEQPAPAQLRAVIATIYRDLIDRLGASMEDSPPAQVIDLALQMSPRQAKVRLECAIAIALSDGRTAISLRDWPDFGDTYQAVEPRRIGFTGW